MLIGTAGHIDHGKTSLIKRLTGRDTIGCRRKSSAASRSSSAMRMYPPATVLALSMCPPRALVHTMLAGATGIDFALMVIAATMA